MTDPRSRHVGVLISLVVFALMAAGCGGEGSDADTGGAAGDGGATAPAAGDGATEETEGSDGGDEATEAAPAPEEMEPFTVGLLACCSVSDVAMLEAIEILRDEGYPVEDAELTEPELIVEAVGTDQFQIGQSATTTILLAVQQGAGLRAIGERMGNEWLVYSTTGIESCEDLDGARIGIHSEGSSSTAQIRAWIEQACPGIEPNYLIVAGAGNRVQAMLAGELDATPLQVDNGVDLMNLAPADFHQLVAFIDEFEIRPNFYIANESFINERGDVVQAWLATIADIHQQINEDPAYLAGLIEKHIPDYNPEIIEQVAQSYSELGLFPSDVGLENLPEDMANTIQFFVDTNALEGLSADLPAEDVLALDPLEAALDQ